MKPPTAHSTSRRQFLRSAAGVAVALSFPPVRAQAAPVLGQGEFRYRVVPGWGVLGPETPVQNCHGMVQDQQGHLILFNTDTKNNVIIYDKAGKLVSKWGTDYPGAHGLSIVREGSREVLFLTDLQKHQVIKTTLDGEVLNVWGWPEVSGKYRKEEVFIHPHDIIVDDEDSLYVAQFASNNTYPIKLERV